MKARIFLSYYRYYQELKCNAIESEYPPEEKKSEVKSSFDMESVKGLGSDPSRVPIFYINGFDTAPGGQGPNLGGSEKLRR